MENTLGEKRVSRKKRMAGEQARDSVSQDAFHNFKIDVYRRVIDQITTSIDERFSANKDLIRNTACLDPRRFPEISCNGLPKESLETMSRLTGLNSTKLRAELTTFVRNFPSLTRSLHNEYQESNVSSEDMETDDDDGDAYDDELDDSDSDDEQKDEQDADKLPKPCMGYCKKCLLCCYKILHRFW